MSAVAADYGVAAQYDGVGVQHHPVADLGMPVDALDGHAVLVQRKAFRAQRDALVYFHIPADAACFADDDAGAVVNENRSPI